MSRIMFSERYGLQAAVLDGSKTMTRRIVKCPKKFKGREDILLEYHKTYGQPSSRFFDCVVIDYDEHELGQLPLPYEVGDVVAIAQSYRSIFKEYPNIIIGDRCCEAGWKNKMFIREDLMPHHIVMRDLWFEHLQDISNEDCIKEGVIKWLDGYIVTGIMDHSGRRNMCYNTPKEAFAALIDRICGRGTWESNPMMVAYSFMRID